MERKFIPGSEWLYFKIYTGVKTSDLILEEAIKPLVEHFQEKNFITKWFFIRYHDPKPHLRLRFKLKNVENYNLVLTLINKALKNYVDSEEISNIIFDTYNREIERYGENTIEFAEDLFCKSSELILNFLNYDDEEKIMVSMFYIDQLLAKINLSETEKLEWVKDSNDAFKREFNADKNLNSQLDRKYREFKPKYLDFVNSNEFEEIRNLIAINLSESDSVFDKLTNYDLNFLSSFFSDIFHMHINRTFISDQRLFEMVVYDYLVRYNKRILLKL